MNNYNFYQTPMMERLTINIVENVEEAKKFPVQMGQTAYLIDRNDAFIYMKKQDGFRAFRTEEVNVDELVNNKSYMTKEDFEKFKMEILGTINNGKSNA